MKLIGELALTGGERVLDLGCGDGALTAELAARVPAGEVVGIDFSPSMIMAAARHTRANLRFVLGDINELAYEEEFDVVFSNSAMHWVKDHRNALARVHRAMRPGGLLRINSPAAGNCATFNRIVREVMAEERYRRYFAGFEWPWYMPTPAEYAQLVGEFPFCQSRVWGENADRFFPDAAALERWIEQPCLVPFLPRVAGPERKDFRDEVVARMVRATRQADGTCFEFFRRVHVFARR